MKSMKDIIYDKSDIVVALLILFVAAAIIINRVDAIMDYPSTFGAIH